jgi:hypothetical protein
MTIHATSKNGQYWTFEHKLRRILTWKQRKPLTMIFDTSKETSKGYANKFGTPFRSDIYTKYKVNGDP